MARAPVTARTYLVDAAIALAVASSSLPLAVQLGRLDAGAINGFSPGAMVAYAVAQAAPLTVRRRWPWSSHLAIVALSFLPALTDRVTGSDGMALLVSLFSLASIVSVRQGVVGAVLTFAGTSFPLLWPYLRADATAGPLGWLDVASTVPYLVLPLVFALVAAILLRRQRARAEEFRADALRAQLEADARIERAAADERRRLAAELHDIVAHHVSLIVVQSEKGPYLHADEAARRTFRTIGDVGRAALGELDRLIGVLRADGSTAAGGAVRPGRTDPARTDPARTGAERAATAPLPLAHAVPALVASANAAGIPVELTGFELPVELDAGPAATAYRVVQECLTNIIRHGDHAHPARVSVLPSADGAGIDITAENRPGGMVTGREGFGLVAMRSRVEALHGRLTVAGGADRFIVRAWLPAHGSVPR